MLVVYDRLDELIRRRVYSLFWLILHVSVNKDKFTPAYSEPKSKFFQVTVKTRKIETPFLETLSCFFQKMVPQLKTYLRLIPGRFPIRGSHIHSEFLSDLATVIETKENAV